MTLFVVIVLIYDEKKIISILNFYFDYIKYRIKYYIYVFRYLLTSFLVASFINSSYLGILKFQNVY